MCWDHLIEAEHPEDRTQSKLKPALPEPSFDQLLDSLLKPGITKPQAPRG